jgi:single-strand DNA-binding protein
MSGVNKVILLGRLGSDPDLKYLPNGTAVCKFSLATSDSYTDSSGQKQEKTEWHKVSTWAKQAENCAKYLTKGRQAYVEGKIETRSWEKDGQKHYSTEINAQSVQFIGDAPRQGAQQQQGYAQQQAPAPAGPYAGMALEDIPF